MATSQPAPRMPVRTRLLRPDIFSDDVTGTLAPGTLLAYLGLGTRADDAAFLVWRPAALAAAVMPYANARRRQRDFERIAAELVEAGLLRILECGCAELPRMLRDLAIGGGSKTYSVRDWHLAHLPKDSSGQVQIPTAESVSSSESSSSSESESGLEMGRERARRRGRDARADGPTSTGSTSFTGSGFPWIARSTERGRRGWRR